MVFKNKLTYPSYPSAFSQYSVQKEVLGSHCLLSTPEEAAGVTFFAFFGRGFGRLEVDPAVFTGVLAIWSCFAPGDFLARFLGEAVVAGASLSSINFRFKDGVRFRRTPDKSCTSSRDLAGRVGVPLVLVFACSAASLS